jgi:hypothetical protein
MEMPIIKGKEDLAQTLSNFNIKKRNTNDYNSELSNGA